MVNLHTATRTNFIKYYYEKNTNIVYGTIFMTIIFKKGISSYTINRRQS